MPEPTQQQLREQQIFENLLASFEKRYAKRLKVERNKLISLAQEVYELTGKPYNSKMEEDYIQALVTLSRENSSKVIPVFSAHQINLFKNTIEQIDRINNLGFHTLLIEEFTSQFTLQKSKLASDTAFNELRNVVANGVNNGLGQAQISKNIRQLKTLSTFRANTIARTETHQAATFAQEKVAERAALEYGIEMMKQWIPTKDKRTRDIHRGMSSHSAIPINQHFIVGGEKMMRPGDPNGSARNVINCRCTCVYKVV